MTQVTCPSCGAVVPFASRQSLLAVCPSCRSLLLRKDLDVELIGEAGALLEDGSPVRVGATGTYEGKGFRVVGRLQVRWENGLWNEWCLYFDDTSEGWLGESQGMYAVTFRAETSKPLPAFNAYSLGDRIDVEGKGWLVRDMRSAEYASAEGELPFRPKLGERVFFTDLADEDGRFATLDYGQMPPLFYSGRYAAFEELKFQGLKEFEGW